MSEYMPEGISAYLKKRLDEHTVKTIKYKYGTVTKTGDGVARILGLPECKYGELLRFENGTYGMALDLQEDHLGAVILDTGDTVREGMTVIGTGKVAEIPVGDEILGRVIDSIGRPLDGRPLMAQKFRACEQSAPKIIERRPVDTPLRTGILAIDSMVPIGMGQRELIIGDRQTGKTSIAIDTILNQKNSNVICIYCAVGQKASTVSRVIETLKKAKAMSYTCVVTATASNSPAMQYLAPFAATSIAEWFMYAGKNVLIIYDDLSKHAVAYRTMSLLLQRPPGREAFPGDVFYLHSRLLERSACLSKDLGGGSLTAIPIIETMGGNISSYIPTNVISITDGQIYLENELFNSGIRPAINTGLSVSRVGRAAQCDSIKKVSGTLRIQLSKFREMAVFARFGSDVDVQTAKMLKKGSILTELFKQQKSNPYSNFEETLLLLAYNNNVFDDVEPSKLKPFCKKMTQYVKNVCAGIVPIIETGFMSDGDMSALEKSIMEFKGISDE
ncbi:MAG: F0F1 ATP synthase subunit alpha [Clostridia bacterium]|nr:F0F1 ATP synthase subunit alpha [Clostridia bacterium]